MTLLVTALLSLVVLQCSTTAVRSDFFGSTSAGAFPQSWMPNGTGNTVMFAPYLLAPTAKVPDTFLSFNFDWNLNKTEAPDAWTNASFGFTLDLQNPSLRTLAKALAPANLRIGGSDADSAIYNEEFPGGIPCPDEVVQNHQVSGEINIA